MFQDLVPSVKIETIKVILTLQLLMMPLRVSLIRHRMTPILNQIELPLRLTVR